MKTIQINLSIKIATLVNMDYTESEAENSASHYENGKLWFIVDGKINCITKQRKSGLLLLGFMPYKTMYYQPIGERFTDKQKLFKALSK